MTIHFWTYHQMPHRVLIRSMNYDSILEMGLWRQLTWQLVGVSSSPPHSLPLAPH